MPRVLIDLERLKHLHCGLGQVCLNLGKTWGAKNSPITPQLLVPSDFVGKFGDKPLYEKTSPLKKVFSSLNPKTDLWHSIHQEPRYLPPSKKTPWMMTIHDLNFLDEKSPTKAKKRLELLQRRIDQTVHLSAISHFTKQTIQERLDLKGRSIDVVPMGIAPKNVQKTQKPLAIPNKKFLFALGVVRPKKNFHVLVDMLARLPDRELTLVISGVQDKDYVAQIQKLIEKNQLEKKVILTGPISDEERLWCFENCLAFVFPSLFEGFGLPILEAMTFGKPVFSSDKTSLPEVGGNAAYYWNDFHPDSMVEVFQKGMEHFNNTPNRPQEVINWAAQFSWDSTVQKFENIYLTLLK